MGLKKNEDEGEGWGGRLVKEVEEGCSVGE
jgi:hypothetical protein